MKRSILVIADEHGKEQYSLEKSYHIAAPLNADLEVVRFLPPIESQSEMERNKTIEQAKCALDDNITSIFGNECQATSSIITTDNVANWVVDACTQKHIDLVVKTGHRSESLFHTPTDWQLIRQLSCPILIVNTHKWKSERAVMATVDLSTREQQHLELNELVLEWTALLSRALNWSTHIAYNIKIAKFLLELDVVEKNAYLQKKQPEAEKQLAKLLQHFEINDAETHITAGSPEKTIPHVANQIKADLVIMGCVGRKGLKGFLIGNTAESVLHHLRTDILIVESSGIDKAGDSSPRR